MGRILLILIFTTLSANSLFSQSNSSILLDAIRYRGLTHQDISIPLNFSDTTATNNNRLLLPIVERMMKNPLEYDGWLDSIASMETNYLHPILKLLYECSGFQYYPSSPDAVYDFLVNPSANNLGNGIIEFSKYRVNQQNDFLKTFNKEEKEFLNKHLLSLLAGQETFQIDERTTDIFKYNLSRDSSEVITSRVADILSKMDSTYLSILLSDYGFSEIMISQFPKTLTDKTKKITNEYVQGEFYFYNDDELVRVAIGGKGKNYYKGKFNYIIDYGGDDVYDLENDDIFGANTCIIVDFSGNDTYNGNTNYSLASGIFSFSYILDKEGDDVYKGKSVSLGVGVCGLGIIEDETGNDIYYANSFSIGAGAFGVGFILDKQGNDIYSANTYSQGFGLTKGAGAIIDNSGNDSYLINSLSLDMGRYEDHFVSMCQGYGLGLRPYYAGGVGLIIEGAGNDIYATDIFGQGGAYWYGLGAIVDKSGHDKYNSYQYAQGSGIHLAVGFLKDYDGWDFYTSNGVSQGCGHDYGIGILDDVKGNDNYSAYSLSQGAGNANGIGILLDRSGRDGYLNKEPGNTRGYGNPRREYGSIGLFVDGAGDDFYSVSGLDSTVNSKSYWGTGLDFYFTDEVVTSQNNESYKVPLEPVRDYYSIEEYFIMAKTIEPRFSLWQKYGEEHLIADSTATAEHMLTKLGTDDHRETFLMRNLIQKIPEAVSDAFNRKMGEYKSDNSILTAAELSMMAYLYGETKSPLGKDALLELTYNPDIRVQSSAVLALGKIKYDSTDRVFIEEVSKRLRELLLENTGSKVYEKNLAYAFKNYPDAANFPAVFDMLNNDFFGSRFLYAEALSKYPGYSAFLMGMGLDNLNYQLPSEYALTAFIYSLDNMTDEEYRSIAGYIVPLFPWTDAQKYTFIKSIMQKRDASGNSEFKQWADEKINFLKEGLLLKVE